MNRRNNLTHVMEIVQSHIANLCQNEAANDEAARAARQWLRSSGEKQPQAVNQWMTNCLSSKLQKKNLTWREVGKNGIRYHKRIGAKLERLAGRDIERLRRTWYWLNDREDEADTIAAPPIKRNSDIGEPSDEHGPVICEEIEEVDASDACP